MQPGAIVPAGQCFELGRRWYEGRLERDWERPTAAGMEQVFRDVGLSGEFWSLT